MFIVALVLAWAVLRTGEGIIPNLTVTECSVTHLDLTLWQSRSRMDATAACIADNATCKEGPCQHMSVTPLEEGYCTILLVSTRWNNVEISTQHVCTLSVSSEAVSSVAPSASQASLGVSPSVFMMMPSGAETPPTTSSSSDTVTTTILIAVPTGLLLLCCVTLGGLFLIVHISCRQTRTRMRETLQIDHVMPNMDPNVPFGVLSDVISRDSVTVYDTIEEGDLSSISDKTQEAYYLNIKNSDNCDYDKDYDHDNDCSTQPAKTLEGYIAMDSSIAETEV